MILSSLQNNIFHKINYIFTIIIIYRELYVFERRYAFLISHPEAEYFQSILTLKNQISYEYL